MRGTTGLRWALVVLVALAALAAALGLTMGCGEECLVYGENCSSSYKLENYGTTDIWCCEGSCQVNGLGDSVCR